MKCKRCGGDFPHKRGTYCGECEPDARPVGETRMFPLLGGDPIPWAWAEVAYQDYSRRFGVSQSLERLAERGGFGVGEWACHYLGHQPHDPQRRNGAECCIQRAILLASRTPPAGVEWWVAWDKSRSEACWLFSQQPSWSDDEGGIMHYTTGGKCERINPEFAISLGLAPGECARVRITREAE